MENIKKILTYKPKYPLLWTILISILFTIAFNAHAATYEYNNVTYGNSADWAVSSRDTFGYTDTINGPYTSFNATTTLLSTGIWLKGSFGNGTIISPTCSGSGWTGSFNSICYAANAGSEEGAYYTYVIYSGGDQSYLTDGTGTPPTGYAWMKGQGTYGNATIEIWQPEEDDELLCGNMRFYGKAYASATSINLIQIHLGRGETFNGTYFEKTYDQSVDIAAESSGWYSMFIPIEDISYTYEVYAYNIDYSASTSELLAQSIQTNFHGNCDNTGDGSIQPPKCDSPESILDVGGGIKWSLCQLFVPTESFSSMVSSTMAGAGDTFPFSIIKDAYTQVNTQSASSSQISSSFTISNESAKASYTFSIEGLHDYMTAHWTGTLQTTFRFWSNFILTCWFVIGSFQVLRKIKII